MKLNLGCGDDIREGYTNVDFRQTHPSVLQVDLSKFPWPFADNSVDEILMLDFLEHFPFAQTKQILLECFRIMKDHRPAEGLDMPPGTGLVIQVPDGRHLGMALGQVGEYLCNQCGTKMYGLEKDNWTERCPGCNQDADDVSYAAMKRLYGGQDYPGNFHQTCFTSDLLTLIARECGFHWLRYDEAAHQWKNWNFKSVYFKGDIW